jgi:porin
MHLTKSMKQQLTQLPGAAILLLSICVATPAHAQTTGESPSTSWANSPYMLGDWGGERTALEHSGIVFNFVSVNDLLVDARSDVANWSRVRGTLDIDFGKAELVQGLTFHITALWQAGGNMGTDIGSIANPSSLVSADTTRLDSWWFQQALAHNKVFIRAGQFAGLDFYGNQLYGGSYIMEPLAGC